MSRSRNVATALLVAGVIFAGAEASLAVDRLPSGLNADSWISGYTTRTERGEYWRVGEVSESAMRRDAADGTPTLCALTLRARRNFIESALEAIEIGVERDAAASTKERVVGTMYLRVRYSDPTTLTPMIPHAIKVWLSNDTATEGWRVDPPDRQGYVRISKPTVDSDESERTAFGWAAGDTEVEIAIKTKPEGGWILYRVDINRVGFPTPAADAMRTCLKATGDDVLTEGAYAAHIRDHDPPK
jgi:hypothetical protein